ncbi:permease [Rothia mucilaginosa]|uniref:Permease n=1 Tax=Rothia mucilaginosa TaxID=43675 RepID=A0A291DGS3_9MICC|nr:MULTISPECIES: permease [Rothia]ATF63597.1 permease [Rothia mucilaginosa]OFM22360.1 permease [Rothia sp. HMSC069D01]
MGMILPLLYLGVGFGLAMLLPEHWGNRLKESASALLTRWIIPTVIVYIVATSRPELFFMAASTMVLMALLVRCAAFFTNDPVQRLAFVYLNAGLFGIPVVAGFWGEEAVRVYIGAYIGNSIMGNILGTSLLRGGSKTEAGVGEGNAPDARAARSRGGTLRTVLRGLRTSPPVIAVVVGLLCLPAGPILSQHGAGFYRVLTWVFSFIGMIVLGMWLGAAKLHRADLTRAAGWALLRAGLVSVYSVGVLALARWAHDTAGVHFDQLLAHPQVLFILAVLPPAANIVILETHYRHEGTAAPVIAAGAVVSVGMIALAVPILQLVFAS